MVEFSDKMKIENWLEMVIGRATGAEIFDSGVEMAFVEKGNKYYE